MEAPEPEPEPEPQPTNDPEAMSGTSASSADIAQALKDNPDLAKEMDKITKSVEAGTLDTDYPDKNSPERILGDKLLENKTTTIDYLNAKTGLNLSGPEPFDQSTSEGAKNANGFISWVEGFAKQIGLIKDPKTGELDTTSPKAKETIAKASKDLQDKASKEPNTKTQIALKILALLVPVIGALIDAWKLKTLKDTLEQIAQSFNECDEVNYSARTQTKLTCDTNNPNLKSNCICGTSGSAPFLQGICTTFDPTHTCPTFDYVFIEYHWYNLFAAVVHGVEAIPSWFGKNKWNILIGVSIFFAILILFGLIKHYAFS